jgi:hypothetical protein
VLVSGLCKRCSRIAVSAPARWRVWSMPERARAGDAG